MNDIREENMKTNLSIKNQKTMLETMYGVKSRYR